MQTPTLRLSINLRLDPAGTFDRPLINVGCSYETIPTHEHPLFYVRERVAAELDRLAEQFRPLGAAAVPHD